MEDTSVIVSTGRAATVSASTPTPTPTPRRVHFLSPHVYGTGGVPRTVLTLAGHLARRGHEVEVLSVARPRETPYYAVAEGVRLRWAEDHVVAGVDGKHLRARDDASRSAWARWLDGRPTRLTAGSNDPLLSLLTDFKLRRLLRSLGPGVLVATRPELAMAATRWTRPHVRVVTQEHLSFDARHETLATAVKQASSGLDAVLTLTEEDRQRWQDFLGTDSAIRVLAIPNTSPFAVSSLAPLDSKIIIAAGRLTAQKGFDRLIDAFAPLAQTHPDWRLHVYGKGGLRSELSDQIGRLGLRRRVRLMGFTDQFEARLAGAAVFAMSSRFEGLPMVLLEAMSKGVPMVSFDCPEGPRQLIEPGVNGLLVENGNVEALTAALRQVMDDDALRTRLGAGALASSARYLPDRVCEQWEALFTEIGVPALRR